MQDDTFKTIRNSGEGLYKEKGSRFLSFAHPVSSVDESKEIVDVYRKKYHDARHVCYAYSIGQNNEIYRVSDDGEPSGTAGKPILGQIKSFGITNVLVVVVRYFGGVLLGTGGLVTAYKTAAGEAIEASEIVERTVDEDLFIRFEFSFLNEVMHRLKTMDARIVSQEYANDCSMHIRIRRNNAGTLREALGKIESLCIS